MVQSRQNIILQEVRKRQIVTSSQLVQKLGISRQAVARYLRDLVIAKKLVKAGSTRNARYFLPRGKGNVKSPFKHFSSQYVLKGLLEDEVFQEVNLRMGLKKSLSAAAYNIVAYAFMEMLNNAIEHSRAKQARISIQVGPTDIRFVVEDKGIGVFQNIAKKFKLQSHFEAVEHLLKGKQTTRPKGHSGQGIFFTSKIADQFMLESAKLCLIIDNRIQDILLKDIHRLLGTKVEFVLKKKSRKELKALFDQYSSEDFEFDKTKIVVHLSAKGEEHISRSQARRMLVGLNKFKHIILDFKKVSGIGQGFTDEVFRVFLNAHPHVQIEPINMSESVDFMIKRALS